MADPESAPGRLTSSPWPDRIEIDNVQAAGTDEYLVTGWVIEKTSADETKYPVQITVSKVDGSWLITAWQAVENQ